jgi:ribonuclease BN (tRNA processing enzyme)
MRLTVLGGCGAWPAAGQACSGYLVEHGGFQLLMDPGYATLPRLLQITEAARIDAVLVSHGHPDHCADLNPLLRARVLAAHRPPPLPVYTLPGALEAGPSDDLVTLAHGADLLLAEATYPEEVPARHAGQLSSAAQAGQAATRAAVGQLMLTHLWPGTDPAAAVAAARRGFAGQISVARPGIIAGPGLLHGDGPGEQPGRHS